MRVAAAGKTNAISLDPSSAAECQEPLLSRLSEHDADDITRHNNDWKSSVFLLVV